MITITKSNCKMRKSEAMSLTDNKRINEKAWELCRLLRAMEGDDDTIKAHVSYYDIDKEINVWFDNNSTSILNYKRIHAYYFSQDVFLHNGREYFTFSKKPIQVHRS